MFLLTRLLLPISRAIIKALHVQRLLVHAHSNRPIDLDMAGCGRFPGFLTTGGANTAIEDMTCYLRKRPSLSKKGYTSAAFIIDQGYLTF